MISKKLDSLLDLIVAKIQESIDAGTDVYCYEYLLLNDFEFESPSIDFVANGIYLVQSWLLKSILIS